ncbi:MAG: CTP synthetase [Phycisphaerae bacterium]|nr:MAG: CTP synthetase [Phycisphaerae bacterium]
MNQDDMFSSIGESTEDTEFFTSLPPGYKPGQTKFVIVVGTVMSGLGKGIFSSSLARILQDKGLSVAPIKLEGYLNRDSGTLNPYRHGEVFVLDDGMECDMDLGTYERMLNQNLTRLNFTTSGQIFSRVLEKERKGEYLGRDVQMIPHVTGEVKYHLRQLAVETGTDVVFVEIGGTAGDVENAYYLEAVRELAFEEGPNSCCFVALTYVVEPPSLGEQKSKPAQLNMKQLMAVGIMPHIIACRATKPVTRKVLEKLAMYSNVPIDRVFSMHDVETVYMIPEALRKDGIDETVLETLDLKAKTNPKVEAESRARWSEYLTKYRAASSPVTIGITGKYTSLRDSYASIIQALEHAGTHHGIKVNIVWIDSTELTDQNIAERLSGVDGVIIPGGFGVRGVDGKIACVKYAREHGLPYLGLCYGFQIAVIEFARNVCGLQGAGTTEIDANSPHPVIDILPEQRELASLGGNMRLGGQDINVAKDSRVSRMYGDAESVRLRFRHRYEVAPQYIEQLEAAGMIFCGRSPDERIMQILELSANDHPYFVATQAHAELTSRPLRPDPMFLSLVEAARNFADLSAVGNKKGARVA